MEASTIPLQLLILVGAAWPQRYRSSWHKIVVGSTRRLAVLLVPASLMLASCSSGSVAPHSATPSIAPSEDELAFVREAHIPLGVVFVARLDGSDLHQVTPSTLNAADPVWSPDGKWIAFAAGSGPDQPTAIYAVSANGTDLTRITQANWSVQPSWSPDGNWIAFARTQPRAVAGIYVIDKNGSGLHQLTKGKLDENPSWSPDSKSILFARFGNESPHDWRLATLSLADNTVRDLGVGGSVARWSPDGTRIVAVAGGGLFVMNADGSGVHSLPACGPPNNCMGARGATWSPDGSRIITWDEGFSNEGGSDLWIMASDGSGIRRILGGPSYDCCASWRPDRAVKHSVGLSPQAKVWQYQVAGHQLQPLRPGFSSTRRPFPY
jgi:Tol biopolymer transport system component